MIEISANLLLGLLWWNNTLSSVDFGAHNGTLWTIVEIHRNPIWPVLARCREYNLLKWDLLLQFLSLDRHVRRLFLPLLLLWTHLIWWWCRHAIGCWDSTTRLDSFSRVPHLVQPVLVVGLRWSILRWCHLTAYLWLSWDTCLGIVEQLYGAVCLHIAYKLCPLHLNCTVNNNLI